MMDNQLFVLCQAHIQFKHVYLIIIFFEQFNGILWSFPASSSVSYTEQLIRLYKVIEGSISVSFALVNDVGEAEKDGGDENVGEGDDECKPLKVHAVDKKIINDRIF